ncbi:MAG: glycerol-3-phosphate dehydrogenase [Rhodospirillales bacterium]|jgi:glycerol-3-phosphate dehydrogenase subunit C|nr:glycerol-3-phosphate dehydrogenase [Rhodospirillales bacterium]
MSGEGGLGAPTRHAINWNDPDFYDAAKLDTELRRVFDICHGCRRCFNLCDSFPRLFDLIDESDSGELDTVNSHNFAPVIDACTLCDMCFMTKCPYVPPHDFDLDFPHLMLRARAIDFKAGKGKFFDKQLTETDRNGKLGCSFAGLSNWATKRGNALTRPLMESIAGVHAQAELPKFNARSFVDQVRQQKPEINSHAPAYGRKVALYVTCFANYNASKIAQAAVQILAQNGVEVEVLYPGCCGMPQLEQGDLGRVAGQAKTVAGAFQPWIDKGYRVVALVPSCALMMKFEWPLIVQGDESVQTLAAATSDISEYICDIARNEGLAEGMKALDGGVTVHIACHARAQNMGHKAAEMLRLIPDTEIHVIERCSGHGGAWGVKKDNFDTALKIGKPAARQALKNADPYLVSECPLARDHILQGIEQTDNTLKKPETSRHPVELLALAYGI